MAKLSVLEICIRLSPNGEWRQNNNTNLFPKILHRSLISHQTQHPRFLTGHAGISSLILLNLIILRFRVAITTQVIQDNTNLRFLFQCIFKRQSTTPNLQQASKCHDHIPIKLPFPSSLAMDPVVVEVPPLTNTPSRLLIRLANTAAT